MIFRDKRALDLSYIPQRILHRQDQIAQMERILSDFDRKTSPRNILGIGQIGTGKTVTARYVGQRVQESAQKSGLKVRYVYVSCGLHPTFSKVLAAITGELRHERMKRGLSQSELIEEVRAEATNLDGLLIILDEAERLVLTEDPNWSWTFYNLSRALPMTSSIMLTTSEMVPVRLDRDLEARAKDTFRWVSLSFNPYDQPQLQDILKERIPVAFLPDAFPEELIPFTAAQSRLNGLGARGVIEMARRAGELAEERSLPSISKDLLMEGLEWSFDSQLVDRIRALDSPAKGLLKHIEKNQPLGSNQAKLAFKREIAPRLGAGASDKAYYWNLAKLKQADLLRIRTQRRERPRSYVEVLEVEESLRELVRRAVEGE